jgi:hypothetical protein
MAKISLDYKTNQEASNIIGNITCPKLFKQTSYLSKKGQQQVP